MLSVIVIAYNEEGYLPGLLDSLAAQTRKDFELVVVDSHSTDRTREIALSCRDRFSAFQLVEMDRPRGPARARNLGVERASSSRLLFLDADTRLAPDFLDRALAALDKSGADIATCMMQINEAAPLSRLVAVFFNVSMLLLQPFYATAFGACLFSTRQAHQALGGFREDLAICEDCEYVKRAQSRFGFRFRVLRIPFGTSDRRSRSEGGVGMMLKYLRVHLYRMFTRNEIATGRVVYEYGRHDGRLVE